MDYTGTGGSAAAGGAGMLAYTGVSDGSMLMGIIAVLLIMTGLIVMYVSKRRQGGDAEAAGINANSDSLMDDIGL